MKYLLIFVLINVGYVASTTTYKLTYFPVMAVAEPIRYLLSYGHIEFEDFRIEQQDWDPQNSPFGSVPLFEINGQKKHQSIAICRYLGNLVNLTGSNEIENLDIDAIADTISEMRSKVAVYNKLDNDSEEKEPMRQLILKETLPFYLTKFNKIAENGYMAANKFTWADIFFVALLDYNNGVLKTDIVKDYPNLDKLRNEVIAIPAIKTWIENRPHSEY